MLIDLDSPHLISPKQLEESLYLKEIIFQLTPDQDLPRKLQKIDQYVPYISRFPLIKTSFRIKNPIAFSPVFGVVAVGGTFDHLHLGHQVLLLYTVLSATHRIHIGVTGEALLGKKKSKEMLESWQIRMKHVQDFVKAIKPQLEVNIFELKDPFGVTIEEPNIDGLVISEETLKGGEKVNEVRAERGMKALEIVICPTISPTKDIQRKISSTTIREYLLSKNSLTIEQYSEYRAAFHKLVDKFGVNGKQKAENWWERLFLNYSEHWRHYHTNQHIFRLLQEWNGEGFAEKRQKLCNQDILIVETAIFFHDIIYRPDSSTNEEDSARLASQFLKDLLVSGSFEGEDLIGQVTLLILETKAHEPSNALSQILYDLDMGVLNSDSKYYQKYAKGIKREYEPIFGQQYSVKRVQLLKKWKDSKNHFSFKPQNLSNNLQWEIFCLQNHDL